MVIFKFDLLSLMAHHGEVIPAADGWESHPPHQINVSSIKCSHCRGWCLPGGAERGHMLDSIVVRGRTYYYWLRDRQWRCRNLRSCTSRYADFDFHRSSRRRGYGGGDWDTAIDGSAGIYEAIDIYGD